jgi:GntR family transcriptional repressor for pyruvate dehydrogenase complex
MDAPAAPAPAAPAPAAPAAAAPARPAPAARPLAALTPLSVAPTAERIADRFVTAIALGQFVAGQRLPSVRNLALLLGVSPNTVRDALTRLADLGHVRITRGRTGGTVVTAFWGPDSDATVRRSLEPQWAPLEQLLDFRSLLEQQIARTAATRRTTADARAITTALAAYAAAGTDRESSRAADLEVHLAIARAAHNPHLVDVGLRVRHEVTLGFAAEPYSDEVRARALVQHPALARAVIEGEPDLAAALAAEHFSLTETTLRDLYARTRGAAQPTNQHTDERTDQPTDSSGAPHARRARP